MGDNIPSGIWGNLAKKPGFRFLFRVVSTLGIEAGDRCAQAEKLDSVPWAQILQDEEEKELNPSQTQDHTFLTLKEVKVKETFLSTHEQKSAVEVKKEWCQPTQSPLHWNPSWLKGACTSLGHGDKPNTDSELGKARWLAKGNPEEMPHLSDSLILPYKWGEAGNG